MTRMTRMTRIMKRLQNGSLHLAMDGYTYDTAREGLWEARRMRERDVTVHELLDAEAFDTAVLDRNLRNIRLINGVLGWRAFTVRAVARYVRRARLERFSLL